MGELEKKDPSRGDGSSPINPDTVREPRPGKRGRELAVDEEFVNALKASGVLGRGWALPFLAVPRREFVPQIIWREGADSQYHPVDRNTDEATWRAMVESTHYIVTQVGDGRLSPDGLGDEATSSVSMPRMVALMLKHLDVHGGERVLEIGTGCGWNAALLAQRLGADRVVTVEIDPVVAARARIALEDAGFSGVQVIHANGSFGHPPEAPYHRVIATAACATVPYAWVEQTRPGGIIVTPWAPEYLNFGLLTLLVHNNGTATGRIVDTASFMPLRDQRFAVVLVQPGPDDEQRARVSKTDLEPADVMSTKGINRGAVIAISSRVPGCRASYRSAADDPAREAMVFLSDAGTGSWARLHVPPESQGSFKVVQGGERSLWDEVEAAHQWWVEQGSPGAEDWVFSVTSEGQHVEIG